MTSDKSLNDTIESLCCNLKPVKPICPYSRSALWILIAGVYTVAVAMMVGFRPQLMDKMLDQGFIFEVGLAFATGISATLATFWLSLPDSSRYNMFLAIPATLFAVMMFWMADRLFMEGMGAYPSTWISGCIIDCALMAGLPAALAILLVRKGASVRPCLMAFNAVLAVSSFGWLGMRFTCPYDSVAKAYFINFLPYVLGGLVLGMGARRLFRW